MCIDHSDNALAQAEALTGKCSDPALRVIEELSLVNRAVGDDGISPIKHGDYVSATSMQGD